LRAKVLARAYGRLALFCEKMPLWKNALLALTTIPGEFGISGSALSLEAIKTAA
jgi:hypothetical protein